MVFLRFIEVVFRKKSQITPCLLSQTQVHDIKYDKMCPSTRICTMHKGYNLKFHKLFCIYSLPVILFGYSESGSIRELIWITEIFLQYCYQCMLSEWDHSETISGTIWDQSPKKPNNLKHVFVHEITFSMRLKIHRQFLLRISGKITPFGSGKSTSP